VSEKIFAGVDVLSVAIVSSPPTFARALQPSRAPAPRETSKMLPPLTLFWSSYMKKFEPLCYELGSLCQRGAPTRRASGRIGSNQKHFVVSASTPAKIFECTKFNGATGGLS